MDSTSDSNNQDDHANVDHALNVEGVLLNEINNPSTVEHVEQDVNNINIADVQEVNINPNINVNEDEIDNRLNEIGNPNDLQQERGEELNFNDEIEEDDDEEDEDEDDFDDDDLEDDDDDDDDDESDETSSNQTDNNESYENSAKPENINYDTELPTSHNYLGTDFQQVIKPKSFYDYNEEITIPLINLPGNHWNDNSVQLLPGQTMPIHFYAPLQIQVIRKTMENSDHLIGILLKADDLRVISENSDKKSKSFLESNQILGVLAEIISISSDEHENPISMYGGDGIIIKVKGRERFSLKEFRKEITGCVVGSVKILPDHVLSMNPLVFNSSKANRFRYSGYLNGELAHTAENEIFNSFSTPAWIFRMYDCTFITNLIVRELDDVFKIDLSNIKENDEFKDPKNFSSWLLTNFPFDNEMRINCLKIDCLNNRLMYMHKLIRSFTNINCAK